MIGKSAWKRQQQERMALAGAGVLHVLLDEDAEADNVLTAQLADPEAAVRNLSLFGAAAVRLLAEKTGQRPEDAHAEVVRLGYGGFIRAWPGPVPMEE